MAAHSFSEKNLGPAGWRLWPLYPAVLLFVAAGTLQNTLVGYHLAMAGAGAGTIGLLMAAYFGGLFAGAFAAPWFVGRAGHFRAFVAAAFLAALIMAGYALSDAAPVWGLMQLLSGFLIAVQYVVVESWLNRVADTTFRGRLFGLYMLFWFLGAGAGPLLMALVPNLGSGMALVAGLMLGAGLVMLPLALLPPVRFRTPALSLVALYRKSPVGAVATLLVGLSFGAAMGMTAAYGQARGFSAGQVSLFVAAFVAGGALTQYPIGHLADHMARKTVLTLCAALSAAACLPIFFDLPFGALCLAALAVGAFALPLYTLGVAMVQDHTAEADRVPTAGGLLLLNSLGAFIGPLLIGLGGGLFGPDSLFVVLAGTHLLLALHGLLHPSHHFVRA